MNANVTAPQIELRPIESLTPYARNSKKHSDEQLALIQSSMVEWGFTNPVLADEKGIVAGHGRVMAATRLYAAGQSLRFPNGAAIPAGMVPVIDCTGWSDAQRRAYVIADNRLAEKGAEWDLEMLKLEIDDLMASGFDFEMTGFSSDDLAGLFALEDVPGNEKDPDDCPDAPETPHSKPGDVWVLGPHRVACGDSTDVGVWDKVMQGELADACWCDPPYNVAYNSKLAGSIKNDDMGDSEFLDLLRGMFGAMFSVMKPGAAIYVAHADTEGLNFRRAFREAGFKLSGCIIWRKDSLVLGRSDYQWMHEPILYGWKPGSAHKWFGGRKQTTVAEYGNTGPVKQAADGRWVIEVGDTVLVVDGEAKIEESPSSVVFHEKPKRSADHPTMKPVGLIEKQLKFSARPGDIVIDCCGGSGSTMMAAERLGMCARLVELDPKFVDVECQRYFDYTGRVPVHAETGEPFPVKRGEA
jgi:DNA modification methylase